MFSSIILFFVVSSSSAVYSAPKSQLTLQLYYEGFCPFCHSFVELQLYPGYQKLGDSFLVELVPYGKAVYSKAEDGTVSFNCQHGPSECLLNRIHACAINQKPAQADILKFVYCDLSQSTISNTTKELLGIAQTCAQDSNISFDKITTCINSSLSDELLLKYAHQQEKLQPSLRFVPTIRFNGVYNKTLEDDVRANLVQTVCNLLNDNKPSVCNNVLSHKVLPQESTIPKNMFLNN